MKNTQPSSETLSREQALATLRTELIRRAGPEKSICRVAAEQGIFCQGFRRYSEGQLKRRYGWISARYPDTTREELEEIADRWQLARQEVLGVETACDVQEVEHDSCGGWDDFTDDDLARFLRELTGRNVAVAK